MLHFVCNMHAVSSVCKRTPLPVFPDPERDYFLCVPLSAFLLPHTIAGNIFYITLSNVPASCSKRLFVYCLISICQHFAMLFSGAKISSHGYFFYSSKKPTAAVQERNKTA